MSPKLKAKSTNYSDLMESDFKDFIILLGVLTIVPRFRLSFLLTLETLNDKPLSTSGTELLKDISSLHEETQREWKLCKVRSLRSFRSLRFQTIFLKIPDKDKVIFCVNNDFWKVVLGVKHLGVSIDCKLDFQLHVKALCHTTC